MIILKNISKSFSKNNNVLKSINLVINDGEVVGLVGPNGAGKTTLMKIISGLIVNYNGALCMENNKSISNLIENPKFFDNKSGLYNIKYFQKLYNTDQYYTSNIINKLNMSSYIKKKPKNYSIGMKQRLSISIALISSPKYLILDEPTSGMDPEGIISTLNFIKQKTKSDKLGTLISSHNLDEIEKVCDKVYFLNNGKISEPYSVNRDIKEKIQLYINPKNINSAYNLLKNDYNIELENHVISVLNLQHIGEILNILNNNNIYPKIENKKKESLEDVYFKKLEEL